MGINRVVLYQNKRDLDQGIVVYLVNVLNKGQTMPKKAIIILENTARKRRNDRASAERPVTDGLPEDSLPIKVDLRESSTTPTNEQRKRVCQLTLLRLYTCRTGVSSI